MSGVFQPCAYRGPSRPGTLGGCVPGSAYARQAALPVSHLSQRRAPRVHSVPPFGNYIFVRHVGANVHNNSPPLLEALVDPETLVAIVGM